MTMGAPPRLWKEALRWGLGVSAMVATWGVGFWKIGTINWKWALLGPVAFFATMGALSHSGLTAVITISAFLFKIDDGLEPAVRFAGGAFLLIGLLLGGWQVARHAARRSIRNGG